MWINTFRVTGKGIFPFDMLRHDACVPRTSDDAINLAFTHPSDLAHFAANERQIELTKYASTRLGAESPTIMRWQSFGWTVSNIGKPFKA